MSGRHATFVLNTAKVVSDLACRAVSSRAHSAAYHDRRSHARSEADEHGWIRVAQATPPCFGHGRPFHIGAHHHVLDLQAISQEIPESELFPAREVWGQQHAVDKHNAGTDGADSQAVTAPRLDLVSNQSSCHRKGSPDHGLGPRGSLGGKLSLFEDSTFEIGHRDGNLGAAEVNREDKVGFSRGAT